MRLRHLPLESAMQNPELRLKNIIHNELSYAFLKGTLECYGKQYFVIDLLL